MINNNYHDLHIRWLSQIKNEFEEFIVENNSKYIITDKINFNLEIDFNLKIEDDEPIYRSINLDNNDNECIYKSWADMGKPPILRRQNAFKIKKQKKNSIDGKIVSEII